MLVKGDAVPVQLLLHFIDFRYQVVERRFQHDLRLLKERIHILEGLRKIFDALDEAIRLIRRSDGRQDAAAKLIARFRLDEIQANAVLDLRLYKLARLEIQAILRELREKKKEARAQYWRGRALEALGQTEEARSAWELGAAGVPGGNEQDNAIKRCKEALASKR